MNLDELIIKIVEINDKYFHKQNKTLDYYNELTSTFYDYEDQNNISDGICNQTFFHNFLTGEDAEDIIQYAKPNEVYFCDGNSAKLLEYNDLAILSEKALTLYEKNKEEVVEDKPTEDKKIIDQMDLCHSCYESNMRELIKILKFFIFALLINIILCIVQSVILIF